ncbi:TIGR02444 family protein [Arsenicitalea aurantiaca]|nr:TIGR02444 family protein [Arsenicitalea aurantiaca]
MTEAPPQGAFWAYSLGFYDDADTQKACLAVQGEAGADVNLVLYMLFRASRGEVLSSEAVAALDAAIAPWREETIVPLRELRTRLKPLGYRPDKAGQERLRAVIKKAELDAEKLEQFALEAEAPPADRTGDPMEAASANLDAYAVRLARPLPEPARERLLARFIARL